ncbi:MAG TPA: tetratricopeptide repeat protein [Chthoniobacteraceae bacterium]|nr:tetratricopeptide repeat protein [Chthoniobacteraceae bacterium]
MKWSYTPILLALLVAIACGFLVLRVIHYLEAHALHSAEYYVERANRKRIDGDIDGAIDDYGKAIEINHEMDSAYNNRGLLKEQKGDNAGALADFNQAIAINPRSSIPLVNRAQVEHDTGDFASAIADVDHALALAPKDPADAYQIRADARRQSGDTDGAIADYDSIIKLEPATAFNYVYRGNLKMMKQEIDAALGDFNHAIQLDPQFAVAYGLRGMAEAQKDDPQAAFADFNRSIELDPSDSDSYEWRGNLESNSQKWSDAVADYRKCCEHSPEDPDYPRLFLWIARARLGETEAGSKELADYLQTRGTNAGAGGKKMTPGDWPVKVAGHLLGTVSEEALLAAANSSDPKTDGDQHCEAWFYTGEKRLLAGDKAGAIDHFHKCIATGRTDFVEYEMARAELKNLGEK